MNWFGPTKQIELVEEGDLLLIRATAIRRNVDMLVPIFLAIWMYVAYRNAHWISVVFVIFVFGSSVWFLFRGKDGELCITDAELVASGDLGGWSGGYVRFSWANISGFEYQHGGEDSTEGLFVRTGGWNATCVMAGLNREQSDEVIAAIYKRFPYVVMAEDRQGWSLFGDGSELISLGLSKPKK